jgi:phosphate-selective porin
VVVRRNVNYTLGYALSRLKLQVQLGQRRDIYLEQNAQVDDQYINATTSWQMSQRNSLALSSSYSKMDYQLDNSLPGIGQRKGTQASNTVTFNRQINPDLTGALSLRRVDVNYEGVSLDYKESRVHFDLNFKF